MKKLLILIVLLGFIISCKKNEENFSEKMIEKLAVQQNGLPSFYRRLNLYITVNNKKIRETNNDELFEFYKREYFKTFKTFNSFLNEVLNRNFVVDLKLYRNIIYQEGFEQNQTIIKEYNLVGFEKFLKKYSKESTSKGEIELNKSIIKSNEYSTIVYILYKNKYDIRIDCYLGKDYIIKREDSFK